MLAAACQSLRQVRALKRMELRCELWGMQRSIGGADWRLPWALPEGWANLVAQGKASEVAVWDEIQRRSFCWDLLQTLRLKTKRWLKKFNLNLNNLNLIHLFLNLCRNSKEFPARSLAAPPAKPPCSRVGPRVRPALARLRRCHIWRHIKDTCLKEVLLSLTSYIRSI